MEKEIRLISITPSRRGYNCYKVTITHGNRKPRSYIVEEDRSKFILELIFLLPPIIELKDGVMTVSGVV